MQRAIADKYHLFKEGRMNQYYWYRTIYNGYEPDNKIKIVAELRGNKYEPFEMSGFLTFKDGKSIVSIHRNDDGSFAWRNNDQVGIALTFDDAGNNLPRLVISPDYWEDGDIYELEEIPY